jgi:hypothetical protein
MSSENAVMLCVTSVLVWLEVSCKSISGGIYHTFVAVNIQHCLVYEGYRICQFGSYHTMTRLAGAVIIPSEWQLSYHMSVSRERS